MIRVIRRQLCKLQNYYWLSVSTLMVADLFIGLGFLTEAPITSTSYDIVKEVASLHIWGIIALIAAGLYIIGQLAANRTFMLLGISIGSAYTLMFGITFIMSYFTGQLQGFPAIVWWTAAGFLHFMAALALPPTTDIQELNRDKSVR